MTKKLFQLSLRNGLLGGLLGFVFVWILFRLGQIPFLIPVMFDFRIILFSVLILYTLLTFRKYYQAGVLYLWQGMMSSWTLIASSGLATAILIFLYGLRDDDWVKKYCQTLSEQILKNKENIIKQVGQEAYTQQMNLLPSTTMTDLAQDYFLKSMVLGLFLTILFSVLLRRLPKNQL